MSDNGTFDRMTGKAKESIGKATGDKETETEGIIQQAEGRAKKATEDLKDSAQGVANRVGKDRARKDEQ
ncbi:CsbD family protein [Actinomyces sp. 2119]|uniref:CsbD family protein n=1 Tax=Actinomyces lilanjuaniae TaxID=2321394 RepID=A0ABM6Z4W5_9ACTO|nr:MULTISPECIES: CsbD family protein [Actinomyces]AYD90136.1 CsbD family protein [Actinomyces lilanjuaniae]RJF41385.1 CsbD family protein [Actinomyces sp. 2119]